MRLSEQQKQVVAALKSVYDGIQFHGIFAKYTRSVSILAKILKLEDAAELHYVMMHLSRLSYLKATDGTYLWGSERYVELLNCDDVADLVSYAGNFLEGFAEDEFNQMEEAACQFNTISTDLISGHLSGRGSFTCHAKVYPTYDQNGKVLGSLAILAEYANKSEHPAGFRTMREEVSESALLI